MQEVASSILASPLFFLVSTKKNVYLLVCFCGSRSSLVVEHSLSKRKVVGSSPACGFFDYRLLSWDNVAEWLRRQPAKLMGFARVGSNPTVVVFLLFFIL